MVSQNIRTLQTAYPPRSLPAYHDSNVMQGCGLARTKSVRSARAPPHIPGTFSVVKSCQTHVRIGNPQCTDVLRDHGLPTLQPSKENSSNSLRRHLRPQVSYLKIILWRPTICPWRLCALSPSTLYKRGRPYFGVIRNFELR